MPEVSCNSGSLLNWGLAVGYLSGYFRHGTLGDSLPSQEKAHAKRIMSLAEKDFRISEDSVARELGFENIMERTAT